MLAQFCDIWSYTSDNVTLHGFVRIKNSGAMASFDAGPTATVTLPFGISNFGMIVGYWGTDSSALQGFLRTRLADPITGPGIFTTFSVPGSAFTEPNGVNDDGVISGVYVTVNGNTYTRHGFILVSGLGGNQVGDTQNQ